LLSPEERTARARLGAYTLHAKVDGTTITEAARRALLAKFEREVDPEGVLPLAERLRRAEFAKRAYYAGLSFKSMRIRSAKAKAKTARGRAELLAAELEQEEAAAEHNEEAEPGDTEREPGRPWTLAAYEAELTEIPARLNAQMEPLQERMVLVWHAIIGRAATFKPELPPRPDSELDEPDESAWLFDSAREYADQLEHYSGAAASRTSRSPRPRKSSRRLVLWRLARS
jgi:hypothetical protein